MAGSDYERLFLEAALEDLEKYLLSKEIYWRLSVRNPSGTPPYPQFTLGWLLFFWRRWGSYEHGDTDPVTDPLVQSISDIRMKWNSAWVRKAAAEFSPRLALWKNYINEYRKNPSEHANRYPYEVQRRVILALLAGEIGDVPREIKPLLTGMDKMVSAVFVPGEFVWESVFEKSFPQKEFWYLYGSLKG